MISFTEAASSKIREIMEESGDDATALRIRASKVGNFTFRYGLQLVGDEEITAEDQVVEADGIKAVFDAQSAEWMKESTVDFVEHDGGAGFQINNPASEPEWKDPVAKKVQLVLDERVQPSLAQHGGWIELAGVEEGVAYVQLGGGCQGCSGAQATLSEGIRRAIIEEVPEISDVVDKTDHGAGTNPFMSH